jgi:arylsulfatase A-like enzyme
MSRARVALGALLLAGVACRRPQPPGVALDLAAAAAAADREGPRSLILFGTPSAMPHQTEGFLLPAEPAAREPYAYGRRQTIVSLDLGAPAPRLALLDLAPYPGLPGQSASVLLNGTPLGRIEVRRRERHLLRLPAEAQGAQNLLELVFEERSKRVSEYGRRMAALLYGLTLGGAPDAGLEAMANAELPPSLSVRVNEGVPSLIQAGPAILRFAFRLPSRAELRFRPSVHAASARGRATLRVTLDGGPAPRELWSAGLLPAESRDEVALPLRGEPGELVRLGLHVEPSGADGPAWGVWGAPRVLGEGQATALPAPAADPKHDRLADALRGELAGVNVLLVVLDAASALHFGCYGYGRATTPEIDRIAAEGALFERAYTPAVYTLAAMSSLWTSQYADEHQNVDLRNASLDRVRVTLAEQLRARGVHTAGFVANGMAGPAFSFDRGFAEFHEVYAGHGSRAEGFRQLVPSFLREVGDRRFFAYLHYREPHAPYDPPAPFDSMFGPDTPLPRALRSDTRRLMALHNENELGAAGREHVVRLYDGNLAYADREVGWLRQRLEQAGLWDKTAVIVTADHGEALLEHGWIGHNAQLYEESTRIPLIVRLPSGRGPRGLRLSGLADLVDLAPTIADLLGLRGAAGAPPEFRGRSLLPALGGAPGKPVVVMRSAGERPRFGVRDERFKLIHDSGSGRDELYDLVADPLEKSDLSGADPLRTAYYRQSLHAWLLGLERVEPSDAETRLTPEQLENLRALGYVQ